MKLDKNLCRIARLEETEGDKLDFDNPRQGPPKPSTLYCTNRDPGDGLCCEQPAYPVVRVRDFDPIDERYVWIGAALCAVHIQGTPKIGNFRS